MKKYLLGAFLIIAMNLSAVKLSEIKGLENLRNYNEIKDTQVEKILNYDETINKDKKIYSVKDNNLFTGAVIKKENNIPCVISPNITELFSFLFIKLALYLIIRVARLLPIAFAIWYKIICLVSKANLKPNIEFADKITVFVAIKKVKIKI